MKLKEILGKVIPFADSLINGSAKEMLDKSIEVASTKRSKVAIAEAIINAAKAPLPKPAVTTGIGLSAAISVLVVWILNQLGLDVPIEVSAAITAIVGYWTADVQHRSKNVESLQEVNDGRNNNQNS